MKTPKCIVVLISAQRVQFVCPDVEILLGMISSGSNGGGWGREYLKVSHKMIA